jgi:SAM-dependent methyltransferase
MRCKLCDSEKIKLKFRVDLFEKPFDIYECQDCRFQFQDLPEKEAYRFYHEDYYRGKADFSYLDERKNEKASRIVWKKRFEKLKSQDKSEDSDKRFLDVGCSFGGLMQVGKEKGYDSYGVEVSEYSGQFARERFGASKVFLGNVENLLLPKDYFSMATLIEVLEHLFEPRKALENIFLSLKKGGVLLIQTADMAGLQAALGGKDYHYYLPGHLSYFNRKNLEKTLRKIGFSSVSFIGGVEFGLLPKLFKSSAGFKNLLSYRSWLRISFYHFLSKVNVFGLHLTSSMVMLAHR